MTKNELKEELELYKQAFAGLVIMTTLDRSGGSEGFWLGAIDWTKPSASQNLMAMVIGEGIPAGAYENVSEETIRKVCKDLGIPDVWQQWEDDIAMSCAQNRALIASMEQAR